MKRSQGFTLVEIMIVVAIIGLLAAFAIPAFQAARRKSRVMACMNNMRKIEAAKDQWSFVNAGNPTWTDLEGYLRDSPPTCPAGGEYDELDIDAGIYCTVHDWRKQHYGDKKLDFEELKGFEP